MKKQADTARLAAPNEAGPRVEVYQKTWCSYSRVALALLEEKDTRFEDIGVTDDEIREREMIERARISSSVTPISSKRVPFSPAMPRRRGCKSTRSCDRPRPGGPPHWRRLT